MRNSLIAIKMYFVPAKLVPYLHGISKLHISCVVEEDKVRPVNVWSVDYLLAMLLPSLVWIDEILTIGGLQIAVLDVTWYAMSTVLMPHVPICFQVGTDLLEEEITKFEDLVQSVDVAAYIKVWFIE